jgi:hypothetical protein
VVGSPGESRESIRRTRQFIKQIKPSMCQYFTLVPYPGTPLAALAREQGWFDTGFAYSDKYSQKLWDGVSLTCNMSAAKHVLAKKQLQRDTAFRDYRNLITGWFRYPEYLFVLVSLFIRQGFFAFVVLKGIRNKNPLWVFQTIYHAFNRKILAQARRRQTRANSPEIKVTSGNIHSPSTKIHVVEA